MEPITHPYVEIVEQALISLAAVCDGANSQDGQGFNGRDARFGHEMAARARGHALSLNMLRASHKMLCTYTKQLLNMEITLPPRDEFAAFIAAHSAIAETEKAMKPKGKIALEDGVIVVYCDYNPATVQKEREIKQEFGGPGFGTYAEGKAWAFNPHALDALFAAFPEFERTPEVQAEYQRMQRVYAEEQDAREVAEMEERMRHESLLAGAGDLTQPLPDGRTLYSHQVAGVQKLLEKPGMILADDLGLGKTIQALIAAKAYGLPVLVICTASMVGDWRKEAARVGVEISTFTWAKIPQPLEYSEYVVIADEAHKAQTWGYYKWIEDEESDEGGEWVVRGVKRTADLLKLVSHERCAARYLLTATPMPNALPSNLFPLLRAINHPIAKDKREFDKRFCGGAGGKSAAHLDELNRELHGFMIRRLKKQCLDLPPFARIMRPVEMSETALARYQEAFDAMQKTYQERVAEGKILPDAEALVMLTHLRRAGEIGKSEEAMEMIRSCLEQDQQIVVFSAFKDVTEALGAELEAASIPFGLITGDVTGKKRDQYKDDFQAGKIKVILCTHGAGGEGITLTAAQTLIQVGRPWTPGAADQADGRVDRIGQQFQTTSYWLQDNILDPRIDALLERKRERIALVLAGKRKTMRGIESIKDIAADLLKTIFEKGEIEIMEDGA